MQELKNGTATEFVGTAALDTIGLVIPGVSYALLPHVDPSMRYHALGIFSSRTGAAGQLTALDDAVKATSTEVLSIELPRDTKGGAGHGNHVVLGADTVADARRAIEIALELTNKYCGELYTSDAGHIEMAYSARAGRVLETAFDVPYGEAFGFIAAAPAAIGLVMADTALKAANVELSKYMTPNKGTSHTNEVITVLYGDAEEVRTALLAARSIGLNLLETMGGTIENMGTPYIG